MLGVASGSKNKSVREFCKKNHYNDWKFVYDPNSDLGGTISSPWCPLAVGQGVGQGLNPTGAGTTQPNPVAQPQTPVQQPNPGTQQ